MVTPLATGAVRPPGTQAPARTAQQVRDAIAALEQPCFVIEDERGTAVTNDERAARGSARVLASVPPLPPRLLGSPEFLADHGVRLPYMAGAMANGIASARMVASLARAGYLASFGAGGLLPDRVDEALGEIRRAAPDLPFVCNFIHSPNEPRIERAVVDLCLRHGVSCVEAAAFMDLTPQLVRYRAAGLSHGPAGQIRTGHRIIAKVSRSEVAERFLRPAPEALLTALVEAGDITAEQARLARSVPMADDLTAEADSGGHTDRRPLPTLLPEIIGLRDRLRRELAGARQVRVGAAGGIGTPAAAHAAFALGAAYIVTGSVNQPCLESGQSPAVKRLLATAGPADCTMAPAADMFEMGVTVQVLGRGTMFAAKAKRLYEVYRAHPGIDEIPAQERTLLEERIFRRPLEDVWRSTADFFAERNPEQIELARQDPKLRMALVFRWYLGLSSSWGIQGTADRAADYQVWCGPSLGAFNGWAAGSYLAPVENRTVVEVAHHLLRGAAHHARATQLRFAGVGLPAGAEAYLPYPVDLESDR
jgi:PfaD family protein